jgi:hypothetical protein
MSNDAAREARVEHRFRPHPVAAKVAGLFGRSVPTLVVRAYHKDGVRIASSLEKVYV